MRYLFSYFLSRVHFRPPNPYHALASGILAEKVLGMKLLYLLFHGFVTQIHNVTLSVTKKRKAKMPFSEDLGT